MLLVWFLPCSRPSSSAMDAHANMDSEFFLNNRVHGLHSVGKGHDVQVVQEGHEELS